MGLIRYSAVRLATMLATVLVGCVVVFLVMKAAPGDPALSILGESAHPDAIAAFRVKHNLDAPVLIQMANWFAGALSGDLGQSLTIAGGVPISELIARKLPNTLFIGVFAVLLAVLVSLVIGTIAALYRGRLADTIATSMAVLGISMPDFWLSYMLVFAFALGLGWLPSYGFVSPLDSLSGAFYSGLLPAIAVETMTLALALSACDGSPWADRFARWRRARQNITTQLRMGEGLAPWLSASTHRFLNGAPDRPTASA